MKVSCVLLSAVLALFLCACSTSVPSSDSVFPICQSTVSNSSGSESPVSSSAPTVFPDADFLQLFEDGLVDLGISYSERVTMAAEYIGGESGYKYKCDGYNIEVYQFDPESAAYSQAESEGTVTMEGIGDFPVYAHNGMVLILDDALPQQVIDLFNSL